MGFVGKHQIFLEENVPRWDSTVKVAGQLGRESARAEDARSKD